MGRVDWFFSRLFHSRQDNSDFMLMKEIELSKTLFLEVGVPQESVLSPLFFFVFTSWFLVI